MARATCVKCGGNRFELNEAEPIGSQYKFSYLQCATCGGVAGLTEFYNAGKLLKDQESEISSLRNEVRKLDRQVDEILRLVKQLPR